MLPYLLLVEYSLKVGIALLYLPLVIVGFLFLVMLLLLSEYSRPDFLPGSFPTNTIDDEDNEEDEEDEDNTAFSDTSPSAATAPGV